MTTTTFILIAAGFFLLLVLDRIRYGRKVKRIIAKYRDRREEGPAKLDPGVDREGEGKDAPKGWGMNDSPFRKRKSGLSWGGGNIKASEASRGERRTFMKR